MTFIEATKTCLRKFVDFKGRASRSEYWYFYLFTVLVTIALGIVDGIIFGFEETDLEVFSTIASLILFLPTLSATVRRYHDTNRSGWWLLGLAAIMIIGSVIIALIVSVVFSGGSVGMVIPLALLILGVAITHLVWLISKGTDGHNRFGPDPLADDITVFD